MKIEEIEINNFRGIPHLKKKPRGENIGLIGPNGSGKSSVIEAVDFLLTGEIHSLSGEGTEDISLKDHAPHVDSDPEDSWVEITFADESDEVTIRRNVADNSLEHEKDIPQPVDNLMEAARRGQHLLSRDEILEFIVARKQSRSDQLRTLLNLNNVKDRRLELQGAEDQLDTEADRKEREFDSNKKQLFELFEEDANSFDEVLERVNGLREELDGDPLGDLDPGTSFRSGLESPTSRASASPIQSQNTKELLETINEWFESGVDEFLELDSEIRGKVEEIRSDEEALRSLDVLQLIQDGKEFLDEDAGQCPLCLTDWDPGELKELLDEREEKASRAKEKKDELDRIRGEALSPLTNVRTALSSLIDILSQHEEFDTEELEAFRDDIQSYEEELEGDLIDELPEEDSSREERRQLLSPEDAGQYISDMKERAEELPDLDALQDAWDKLQSSYEKYKTVEELRETSDQYREAADQMGEVHQEYLDARDEVLNDIYDAISDQFEDYYRTLHGDEAEFSPEISPTETGLDIKVGFHGRGKHPPHALHSEGHQDSMGLCLYLALSDYLEGAELPLIMLDDVVMSVDAEHRRPLAKLLKEEISEDYQIILTTHDELWYRHLKTVGVLPRRSTIKFSDWSIEGGPQIIGQSGDEWDRIEELMEEGDVPAAAHRLRHTAEWFLREACHQFGARVEFKSDGRWTLGDFSGPAQSKFKDLLKKAKRAEQSWGNDISDINELDNKRSEVYTKFNNEQGSLNPNVHYNENEWASFTAEELEPVVEAYRDLYDLFWCDNCNSCLQVMKQDFEEVQLRCSCGQKANWTLEEK